jgi:DNA-binding NarL/FixJ family response regulator
LTNFYNGHSGGRKAQPAPLQRADGVASVRPNTGVHAHQDGAARETMAATTFRVLVVAGRDLIRAKLQTMLVAAPQVQQVGEAANGREALKMLEQGSWDLVLLDLWLADSAGWGLCGHIRVTWPQVQVLLMGDDDGAIYDRASEYAGAAGYVSRKGMPKQLHAAIRAVSRNTTYFRCQIPPPL